MRRPWINPDKRLIFLICHRRENFGSLLHEICRAVKTLAAQRQGIEFIFPVHPNPNVEETVYATLKRTCQS